ncbi:MAG: exonuclease domain-containing protein [Planctomycetota bacterium]
MPFLANFCALDFETANRRRDSACQLGIVRVRDGGIVERAEWLIRPRPMFFSPGNIAVHGITPDRVAGEPEFGELWNEIAEQIGDDVLVAHNASFDIGVLRESLVAHRCTVPELQFTCTRAIAKRVWPHRSRFGLKPLSEWLGVSFRHHDALEDAEACAKILLAAGIDRDAESLEDLEQKLRLSRGTAGDRGQSTPRNAARTRKRSSGQSRSGRQALGADSPPSPDVDQADLQRLLLRAEFIRPLQGQRVLLSGRLRRFNDEETRRLTERLGGTWQSTWTEDCDLLVVGKGDAGTDALRERAEQARLAGKAVRVVDETGFLGLVIARESVADLAKTR